MQRVLQVTEWLTPGYLRQKSEIPQQQFAIVNPTAKQ
jgi:hypothetical protein